MIFIFLYSNFLSVLFGILFINAEVSVMWSNHIIYDRSPKLRIRGSNFHAEDHNIILEIGVSGGSLIKTNVDYSITKDNDGNDLILKLLENRK
jgi:hypothetical protein